MEAIEIVEGLAGFADRGAGTDAERRAAGWLAWEPFHERQDATVETFWCRPNWALAHALHAGVAVAGSLISLVSPVAGTAVLGVALISIVSDALTGISTGRRLTRARASQNVVRGPPESDDEKPVRLILTANYDAGRTGLVDRDLFRRRAALLRRAVRAFTPGWIGWLTIASGWLLAIAIARLTGHTSHAIGAAQLPPTVAALLGFALLLDVATARWSPAAGDNASGVAVAVALASTLERLPPQHLEIELVLTGAGDRDQLGLRRHLRKRRGERTARNAVVLGFAACAAGRPRWWSSDGPLIPLRYARPLRELAQRIATDEPHLELRSCKGRGSTPALPARLAGLPAIAIGCLDHAGQQPHSHQRTDTVSVIDSDALDAALQFALLMVDAIDTAIGELQSERAATPA